MADSVIDSSLVIMKDRFWPGSPITIAEIPTDGWTGSNHHNVATPAVPVGTKKMAYHQNADGAGVAGWYTMIYLQFGTKLTASTPAAKSLCVPQDVTMTYKVTNNAGAAGAILDAGGVYMLSSMTENYYGWFLCDGVFPTDARDIKLVSAAAPLDGDLQTTNAVAAKSALKAGSANGDVVTAASAVLTVLANTDLNGGFGYSIIADD